MIFVIVFLGSYGLASIPFGLIVTRLFDLGDIKSIGSGNIGATNVLRTGNKAAAAITLLLDMGKGALAVFAATALTQDAAIMAVAATASVIGHCFPLWLRFRGGKGIATGIGAIAALSFVSGLLIVCLWLLAALISRRSSIASLFAFIFAPLVVFYSTPDEKSLSFALAVLAIAVISVYQHRSNIGRIIRGDEPKIGE